MTRVVLVLNMTYCTLYMEQIYRRMDIRKEASNIIDATIIPLEH